MGSNRGKYNIAIAILEKLLFLKVKKNISYFDGSNNIFADFISFYGLLVKILMTFFYLFAQ